MKKLIVTSSLLAAALLAVLAVSTALARDGGGSGKARLTGFQEVPSISTTGRGSFRARIRSDGIHYTLRYEDLETNATAAHIHFAERHVAGGVIAFLCGGGGKPACPPGDARVDGVIRASDVIGPTGQGIEVGSLAEAIRALRHGAVYANVHTTRFGDGEIRGQVGHHGKNGDRHK
jgi:hypothetical protein